MEATKKRNALNSLICLRQRHSKTREEVLDWEILKHGIGQLLSHASVQFENISGRTVSEQMKVVFCWNTLLTMRDSNERKASSRA